MDPKQKLLEIYNQSLTDNSLFQSKIDDDLDLIKRVIEKQKGIFTVLITLGIYKTLYPSQDIRNHQSNIPKGFSGRTIDTKFITPTLKELKLTSMSESGWLTRSLEQPYPYNFQYNGKVGNGNESVKQAFLRIVDFIQNNHYQARNVVAELLKEAIKIREGNKVEITPITDPDRITIENVVNAVTEFMNENYHISGGSKIPVLCFYAIYQIIVSEMKRFDGCTLGELGSHTSSDRTAKTSGDIEVFLDDHVFESVEVKFDIEIDSHMINRACEKIHKFNPKRYYILSTSGIKSDERHEINEKVTELKSSHGCQLIINGLIPTLKYYLRLVSNIDDFITQFTLLVTSDPELKIVHKNKWKSIHEKYFN